MRGIPQQPEIYKIIGEKMRDLRLKHGDRGISQEALAAAIGTTPNTISRWETATYKPAVADLERLARFFGVPISAFFPTMEPTVRVQALLSATGELDDEEFEELTRWALFRKARRELNKSRGRR
jgi:transcriptional regulator with XRE-family HTH domain